MCKKYLTIAVPGMGSATQGRDKKEYFPARNADDRSQIHELRAKRKPDELKTCQANC